MSSWQHDIEQARLAGQQATPEGRQVGILLALLALASIDAERLELDQESDRRSLEDDAIERRRKAEQDELIKMLATTVRDYFTNANAENISKAVSFERQRIRWWLEEHGHEIPGWGFIQDDLDPRGAVLGASLVAAPPATPEGAG